MGIFFSIALSNRGYWRLSQICRSIMLDSHLTTYIPQAVNNIPYFLHYFTSKRLRIFLSPQFEKKKSNKDSRKERTWTKDHSFKNLRSIHLGYLRADDCRWKKVDQTISNRTAMDYLYSLHRDTTLSSPTFRVEGQVSGERTNLPGIRLLFPSASKIPAWLFPSPYRPRLRLGQYVGSENNRRYFLGLEK